jgi:hypothetical protein
MSRVHIPFYDYCDDRVTLTLVGAPHGQCSGTAIPALCLPQFFWGPQQRRVEWPLYHRHSLTHAALRDRRDFPLFELAAPSNAACLLGLRRSARLVQVVCAEHHSRIRGQVGEGDVDAGRSDSTADPPEFARAVLHF